MPKARSRKLSKYRGRRRWSQQDARNVLAAQTESGLPVSAFAKREGFSPHRLYQWRRRLRTLTPSPVLFEEVHGAHVGESPVGAPTALDLSGYGILLPSGEIVRAPKGFTIEMLARLLYLLSRGYGC